MRSSYLKESKLNDELLKVIAKKIRIARRVRDLNQRVLSDMARTPVSACSNVESGRIPTLPYIIRLCRQLDVHLSVKIGDDVVVLSDVAEIDKLLDSYGTKAHWRKERFNLMVGGLGASIMSQSYTAKDELWFQQRDDAGLPEVGLYEYLAQHRRDVWEAFCRSDHRELIDYRMKG